MKQALVVMFMMPVDVYLFIVSHLLDVHITLEVEDDSEDWQ
jgi:hypothetical protein